VGFPAPAHVTCQYYNCNSCLELVMYAVIVSISGTEFALIPRVGHLGVGGCLGGNTDAFRDSVRFLGVRGHGGCSDRRRARNPGRDKEILSEAAGKGFRICFRHLRRSTLLKRAQPFVAAQSERILALAREGEGGPRTGLRARRRKTWQRAMKEAERVYAELRAESTEGIARARRPGGAGRSGRKAGSRNTCADKALRSLTAKYRELDKRSWEDALTPEQVQVNRELQAS